MKNNSTIYKVIRDGECLYSSPVKKDAKDYARALVFTNCADTIIVIKESIKVEYVDILQPTLLKD